MQTPLLELYTHLLHRLAHSSLRLGPHDPVLCAVDIGDGYKDRAEVVLDTGEAEARHGSEPATKLGVAFARQVIVEHLGMGGDVDQTGLLSP